MRKILTLVPLRCAAAALVAGLVLAATACGSDESGANSNDDATSTGAPTVVVTTNILGDVVSAAFGDLIDLEVIMPAGADPHEFAASAKQATAMEDADLLVVNGAGFEAGLSSVIDAVAGGGTRLFTFADQVELLAGAAHADEDQADEAGDDQDGSDPHLWTDPLRVAQAVTALGTEIGTLPGVDPATATERAASYVDELTDLDADITEVLAPIPAQDRILVTNHEVFGYFADRYEFTVAGAVVPSLSTNAESSAKELEALAALLRTQEVRVIFAETTQSTQLAEALAAEVGGDVKIVELFTESLGEPGSGADTYLGMMRTNAQLVADALLGGS